MNENTSINFIYPDLWVPTAGLLQGLAYAAVCLPDEVQKCLWIQEATGKAWTDLEQSIIDIGVNKRRKHLHAYVRIMVRHFEQFYCRQLKNRQLDIMSAKVSEMWTNYIFVHYVD